MKKICGVVLVILILFVVVVGFGQYSEHKFKAEIKINGVTLSQATDVERKLREIQVYGKDGKPLKIDVEVKMD